jgi:hypothetical protein
VSATRPVGRSKPTETFGFEPSKPRRRRGFFVIV